MYFIVRGRRDDVMLNIAKARWIYHCERVKMAKRQRRRVNTEILMNRLNRLMTIVTTDLSETDKQQLPRSGWQHYNNHSDQQQTRDRRRLSATPIFKTNNQARRFLLAPQDKSCLKSKSNSKSPSLTPTYYSLCHLCSSSIGSFQ